MVRKVLVTSIRFYQILLSPLSPPCCRFIPTCSNYSIRAIERYGILKGIGLSFKRLLKCHPFHPGGYDPVK